MARGGGPGDALPEAYEALMRAEGEIWRARDRLEEWEAATGGSVRGAVGCLVSAEATLGDVRREIATRGDA